MRSLWWLAVAVIACGDIEKVPDAAVPDTYAPDSKNELRRSGGETACMGGCANMMTDELNCGACGNQCSPCARYRAWRIASGWVSNWHRSSQTSVSTCSAGMKRDEHGVSRHELTADSLPRQQ